ncbi:MAG: hypothetical protein Q7S31_02695 [bacterium]|nr:hypothetical protein [bacterium]
MSKKSQPPAPAPFDKNPQDFFRGSRGLVHKPFGQNAVRGKGFIGMRRGSR